MARRDLSRQEAAEHRASIEGLGLAVERLRREAELTCAAVGRRGGLSRSTVAQIEKGLRQEPHWETLRRLAKGLDVRFEHLVKLSFDLAPGAAGERLRRREEEAVRRGKARMSAREERG